MSLSSAGFIPQNPGLVQPPSSLLMPLLILDRNHPPCAGLREATAQGDLEMLNPIKNLYRLDGRNPCR